MPSREPDLIALPLVPQTLDFTCGAACFSSMIQYLMGTSPGEMHFAKQLGALEMGFTDPHRIVFLAQSYNLTVTMKRGAALQDLRSSFQRNEVIFVTWWDEDAGHYSLIKHLSDKSILLMDPWLARESLDHQLDLENFLFNWKARGSVMIAVRR